MRLSQKKKKSEKNLNDTFVTQQCEVYCCSDEVFSSCHLCSIMLCYNHFTSKKFSCDEHITMSKKGAKESSSKEHTQLERSTMSRNLSNASNAISEANMPCESCTKCKSEFKGEKIIGCDGLCKGWFHLQCGNLNLKQYTAISSCKTVKWYCELCYEKSEVMVINLFDLTEEMKKLNEKLAKFNAQTIHTNEMDTSNSNSYSSVLKQGTQKGESTLIVNAKLGEKGNAIQIEKDIKEVIELDKLQIGVSKVKKLHSGKVVIEGENNRDMEKLRNEIENKLGAKYEVTQAKKRRPRIKIVGMLQKLGKESLEDKIILQNDLYSKKDGQKKYVNIEVVTVYESGHGKYSAIVELDPNTFNKIMQARKLKIGWAICKVYEHFSLMRCYKCNGYNHKAEKCTNSKTCGKCGGQHETKECDSANKKCINCMKANERLKLNLDENHSAFDSTCKVFQNKVEIYKRRTNYEMMEKY